MFVYLVAFGLYIRAYSFAVWAGMAFTLLALGIIDALARQKIRLPKPGPPFLSLVYSVPICIIFAPACFYYRVSGVFIRLLL